MATSEAANEDVAVAAEQVPTAEGYAEDKVLRDLSRKLEEEPESSTAYSALATEHARKGLDEPVSRKPISAMTVAEIEAAKNPYPGSSEPYSSRAWSRYSRLAERKREVEDEIAAARVLARKGLAPDSSWRSSDPNGEDDPRLLAWKSVAWTRLRSGLSEAGYSDSFSLPNECPSLEKLVELERTTEKTLATLKALRAQLESEAGL